MITTEIKELIENIKIAIAILDKRMTEEEGKYVMVNDKYIQVDEGKGLNGTNVNIRCAVSSSKVVCFNDETEAFRSADYYLKNGAGEPILLKPMKADSFFSEEVKNAQELIAFIENSSR